MSPRYVRSSLSRAAHERTPTAYGLEYAAFRELHEDVYVRYAHIRTDNSTRASRCVEAVFDTLCTRWPATLSSDCPAARAWFLLREQAGRHTDCTAGHAWSVHCLLPDPQADTVLLHCQLGLSVAQTADLMGVPDHTVRALLRGAQRALRSLPHCVTAHLAPAQASLGAHNDTTLCAGA